MKCVQLQLTMSNLMCATLEPRVTCQPASGLDANSFIPVATDGVLPPSLSQLQTPWVTGFLIPLMLPMSLGSCLSMRLVDHMVVSRSAHGKLTEYKARGPLQEGRPCCTNNQDTCCPQPSDWPPSSITSLVDGTAFPAI